MREVKLNNWYRYFAITLPVVLLAGCAAPTEDAGRSLPFQGYEGQSINVIINYTSKGNTSLQAKSILRHLKRHIPGKPRFDLDYVSGNGGLNGANFLGQTNRRNGLRMGIFTIPVLSQVLKAPELQVDFRDFEIIGAIGEQTISHIRADAIPGKRIRNYRDILFTKHAIRTGGHGYLSSKDLRIRLFFDTLKLPHRHVAIYQSSARIRAAILRNELDLTSDTLLSYRGRVVPQLINTGISVPLWHVGHMTLDGELKCSESVPEEIPCFVKVYEEKFGKGKRPAKLHWDAIRTVAGSREILRVMVFPKGTPQKAVDIMRAAWVKTMMDPAYLKEYNRMNRSPLVAMKGADAQRYLRELLTVSPELQNFLLKYAAAGKE